MDLRQLFSRKTCAQAGNLAVKHRSAFPQGTVLQWRSGLSILSTSNQDYGRRLSRKFSPSPHVHCCTTLQAFGEWTSGRAFQAYIRLRLQLTKSAQCGRCKMTEKAIHKQTPRSLVVVTLAPFMSRPATFGDCCPQRSAYDDCKPTESTERATL
jgi:hypothetical protein